MKRIEFGELRIGETARKHINECLDNNWVTMGPKVKLFEEKFAELMDSKYCTAMSSGTSALTAFTLYLKQKFPKKKYVIVPGLSFIATSTSVIAGGLLPLWVDVEHDMNISVTQLEESLEKLDKNKLNEIAAIYAVGTMGCPPNMPKLREIADKYGFVLFHDACEDYGSKINSVFTHKYADAACSSHYTAHLVVAGGEMGCVWTDNPEIDYFMKSIRSHGREPNTLMFHHNNFGLNFKTTDLAASIGLEGIEQYHDNIRERKEIWRKLVEKTKHLSDKLIFSKEPEGYEVMPHGFSITTSDPLFYPIDNLKKIFDDNNIAWKLNFGMVVSHYGIVKILYEKYDDNLVFSKNLMVSDYMGNNGIHIGCHRYMTDEDINRIVDCLNKFIEKRVNLDSVIK